MTYVETVRRARKDHRCEKYPDHYRVIARGERYLVATEYPGGESGYADAAGRPVRMKLCADCAGPKSMDPAAYAQELAERLREPERFNALYPVGTPVRYWPGAREGEGRLSVTRTPAWNIGENPAVSVDGYSGGIVLTHVEVLL